MFDEDVRVGSRINLIDKVVSFMQVSVMTIYKSVISIASVCRCVAEVSPMRHLKGLKILVAIPSLEVATTERRTLPSRRMATM